MSLIKKDILIFGGGLAGSILAETLIRQGRKIIVVDDPSKSQCSRVAAGLINPIGGKRLNLVWKAEELIPFARDYYQSFERRYQTQVYHPLSIARLFANPAEETLWQKRSQESQYTSYTAPLESLALPKSLRNQSTQGFAIPKAAYLDTESLLDSIHALLRQTESYLEASFDYSEVTPLEDQVSWRNYAADYAVFTEGHLATQNPWFNYAPYKPAKGIIGIIESRIPFSNTAVIREHYLIPRRDGTVTVGATYDWENQDDHPDPSGTQKLEAFLDKTLGEGNWTWRQIRAGVRPATAGAKPIVGPHPKHPRLISFNGFGSKGSMQIPYFASLLNSYQFVGRGGEPATPFSEVSPKRFLKKTEAEPKRWKATEIARDHVLEGLHKGDTVIDATAGNGHDTLWLAKAVGPTGKVHAFDIQEAALDATRERLAKENRLTQAQLHHTGHENLLKTLPKTLHGKVATIVFNLGYLPRSDKSIITLPETTLTALKQSLELLKPNGLLSIVLYPAHQGGGEETKAVLDWSDSLSPKQYQIRRIDHPNSKNRSPFPVIIVKRD